LIVWSSKSGNWIPSFRGHESFAGSAATSFSADIISFDDVLEAVGAISVHFVEKRIQESERFARGSIDLIINQTYDTSKDRGGSRCSTNSFNFTISENENFRSESRNIRESTSSFVVHSGRREGNTRGQVSLNIGVLVRRGRSNEGETTTRGIVSLLEAYTFFSTARSTFFSRTSRRRIWEVRNTSGRIDLSSTNRGDVRGGGRVWRVKVVLRAIRISTSVSSRVTRSRNEGNSTETNLLELSINGSNVSFGVNSKLVAFI